MAKSQKTTRPGGAQTRIAWTGEWIELRSSRRHVESPNFAVYLPGKDPGTQPWEHRWVQWRGFRTPTCTTDALAALREAHERSGYERVEIACRGGAGRTGTALALLSVMAGTPACQAVAWVREHYRGNSLATPLGPPNGRTGLTQRRRGPSGHGTAART